MTPLRSFIAGAAVLVLTPAIAAAQACMQPAEQQHFHVRALQSQLMVLAISCEKHDDYNQFVTRFQPQLAAAFRGVQGHFRRTTGARHQRETDQFITNLANGQSQVGISQGTHFCQNQVHLFQEALSAPNVQALAQITQARSVPVVYDLPTCPERAAPQQRQRTQQQQRASTNQQPRQQRAQSAPASATR